MPIDSNILLANLQPLPQVTLPSQARAAALENQQRQAQLQQVQQSLKERQAFTAAMQQTGGDLNKALDVYSTFSPEHALEVQRLRTSQAQEQRIGSEQQARDANLKATTQRTAQKEFDLGMWKAVNDAKTPEDKQAAFTDFVEQGKAQGIRDLPTGLSALTARATRHLPEETAKELLAQVAPRPKAAPSIGTVEDYLTRAYGENPTPDQIIEGRNKFEATTKPPVRPSNPTEASLAVAAAGGDVNAGKALAMLKPPKAATGGPGKTDIQLAVEAMKEGSVPPQLPGRASKDYTATLAEAKRQGYDLSHAVEDWTATQRYLGTLNGAQQTRLRQAVSFTKDSLDVVDDLAKQWKGGRFPLLNKGQLATAKSGVLGPNAQSLATRLEAQINDLTSELGTVYKGGNSSTDESLKLAASNLKADWSEKTLLDAVKLARQNLQIRENSMKNLAPVTSGSVSTAPGVPMSGTVVDYVRDASGRLVPKK